MLELFCFFEFISWFILLSNSKLLLTFSVRFHSLIIVAVMKRCIVILFICFFAIVASNDWSSHLWNGQTYVS